MRSVHTCATVLAMLTSASVVTPMTAEARRGRAPGSSGSPSACCRRDRSTRSRMSRGQGRAGDAGQGDTINTGVTAILPHNGNIFRKRSRPRSWSERFRQADGIHAGAGVGRDRIAGGAHLHALRPARPTRSSPTSWVSRATKTSLGQSRRGRNQRRRPQQHPRASHYRSRCAPRHHRAKEGPVEQGSVGAGRGTVAFGWKGGIGTSSRKLSAELGRWDGGRARANQLWGHPHDRWSAGGEELGQYYLKPEPSGNLRDSPDGSIMIVVATDAPIDHRNLERLARRALAAWRVPQQLQQRVGRLRDRVQYGAGVAP